MQKACVSVLVLREPYCIQAVSRSKTGEKITIESPMPDHHKAIELVLQCLTNDAYGVIADLDEIGAVGHRVGHGGEKLTSSVIINDQVVADIEECCELAPLHNPANLTGITVCHGLMPQVPQVAVFDTAFHQQCRKRLTFTESLTVITQITKYADMVFTEHPTAMYPKKLPSFGPSL